MRWTDLFVVLVQCLLFSRARSARIPKSPAFTVLLDNTLEPDAVQSRPSYLLLRETHTQERAAAACSTLGEALATVKEVPFFQPLLLLYPSAEHEKLSSPMWLAENGGACTAYSLQENHTSSVECTSRLRALCTNTAEYQAGVSPPSTDRHVFVDTSQGLIKGFRDRLTARFQGIPYAKPPVGERRLKNPERLHSFPGQDKEVAYDATRFRALCPVRCPIYSPTSARNMTPNATPDLQNPHYRISEDCLYLNVYTPMIPESRTPDLLPVVFWIHGGSNYYGGSSLPFYLGMNLASRGPVVVVSLNYRLGALGFLSDPSKSPDIGSNQAMRDQLMALDWVREHIKSFGGDPERVTIFGESSGGSAVMSLLQTASAEGLFARAIVQSGSTWSGWQRPHVQAGLTRMFLDLAGCDDLTCVKNNRTMGEILEYQNLLFSKAQGTFPRGEVNFIEPFRPFIDHDLITEDWVTALENGRYQKVPTLVTYTRDEFGLIVQANETLKNERTSYSTAVEFLATFLLGEERTRQVLDTPELGFNRSLVNAPDVTDPFIQLTTDLGYRCSSEIYAGLLERHNRDVWEVSWDIGLPQFLGGLICGTGTKRACHAAELPILFGSANYANISSSALASVNYFQQARNTIDLYSNFAHDGELSINATYYSRRDGNTVRNVLHWNDTPASTRGGVHWDICQKMEEMNLYDRLYYPYLPVVDHTITREGPGSLQYPMVARDFD
ncbi:carboxylesterase type B [Aspergillus campestris IBT 28561]|uniref:Carboxylesterase type B n=1 Tax=Aspergillus campestris (strain IBT 28561) TaxID=1392248 RepID=A0A2I1D487_ASPC2|nr:carboxylesterase type B [Aspergillus campestris IBT 28561]PKY04683.1 carboxylesterase type B [Aspergillus campestris IBT 28561]